MYKNEDGKAEKKGLFFFSLPPIATVIVTVEKSIAKLLRHI